MNKIKLILLAMLFSTVLMAVPLSSNFTYQGQLKVSNVLVNGSYDFQFTAYDTDGLPGNLGTSLAQVQVAAVNVVNGVFTVQLDFAGVVFQGDKVWLEIAVRNGGGTGGFQQLLPRQEVTSAPYAIQAQYVSADAITGAEIFNGSVSSVDLASNSVTAGKIATDAVGSSTIIANAITASELADGSVDTAAIQDSAVTSLKIANNSITSSDLATNSVTASAIASNAVGSSEVISSQVQLRVNATCEDNYVMVGINSDGSVQCRRIPVGLDYSVLREYYVGSSGFRDTSIGISPVTTFPMTSYYDPSSRDLRMYICTNKSCTGKYARVLDTTSITGLYNSLAFRANGNPIISYYDSTNGALKVYDCNNATCSTGTARTLYSTGSTGRYTSIAVDPATDRPIISYRDGTALRVYACADSQCTSGYNGIKDNTADVFDTDIGINPITGYAQISYFDNTNGDLKLYTCTNANCSAGGAMIVDSAGTDVVGRYSSIVYNTSGSPKISYYDTTNSALKFANCTSTNCSTKTIMTLDSVGDVGAFSSAIYNPVSYRIMISYYDGTNGNLKVFVCYNSSCSFGGDAITVDSTGVVGQYSDMTVGSDGLPFISYGEYTYYYKTLKIFSCGDYNCER